MTGGSRDGDRRRGVPLRRVLRQAGAPDALGLLAERLSGADLTTLLLEAIRIRAGRVTATDVVRRYHTDRFAIPSVIGFRSLRRAEDALLAVLPDDFDMVTLSPVVPLGTHSAVATVHQNNVVATVRSGEVAADPTNGLALEVARRRRREFGRDPRSRTPVRLAALQRVVRAQRIEGEATYAHFELLGLVSGGRDTGGLGFELEHIAEHLRFAADAVRVFRSTPAATPAQAAQAASAADGPVAEIRTTALQAAYRPVTEMVRAALRDRTEIRVVEDPGRLGGRGYYTGWCFKVFVALGDRQLEVADGGLVDWTQRLLGNRKERLFVSGFGVDRIATALDAVFGVCDTR